MTMIGALCLIALGSVSTLYFTQESFRKRVNDLFAHAKSLFNRKSNKQSEEQPELMVLTPPTSP